jgi:hypothetical protein
MKKYFLTFITLLSVVGLFLIFGTDKIQAKKTLTQGQKKTNILTSTAWQGTKVYDKQHHDLTKENQEFIGLAKYDKVSGRYEFFDKKTKQSRGDAGIFFITADGKKRILISQTKNYQAVVDLIKVSAKKFTYKRMGKDQNGQPTEVFVEHVPYTKIKLKFSTPKEKLTAKTGKIVKKTDGAALLAKTLWQGQKVVDQDGNDVTAQNQQFISLAKFDAKTNKYEFFNPQTGQSKGDFGYFAVLANNKIRAHVSLGQKKYGAVLELTEFNPQKFTYKRMGTGLDGQPTTVYVEHVPYKGDLTPKFSF